MWTHTNTSFLISHKISADRRAALLPAVSGILGEKSEYGHIRF